MTVMFAKSQTAAVAAALPRLTGQVTSVVGLTVTVAGLQAAVGDLVRIESDRNPLLAEVVALGVGGLTCLPLGTLAGISCGTPVSATGGPLLVPVGAQLRGRVLDGLGRPIDDGPPLTGCQWVPVDAVAPPALYRSHSACARSTPSSRAGAASASASSPAPASASPACCR
jgi:flagellum-specific ATP synthase